MPIARRYPKYIQLHKMRFNASGKPTSLLRTKRTKDRINIPSWQFANDTAAYIRVFNEINQLVGDKSYDYNR